MSIRKLALQEAIMRRTCPPEGINSDPAHAAAVRKHRENCLFCAVFAPGPPNTDPPPKSAPEQPEPGMSRMIEDAFSRLPPEDAAAPRPGRVFRMKGGGWDGALHRNPPLILILDEPPPAAPFVWPAALISSDPDLAGPGDLAVRDIADGPPAEYIVQVGGRPSRIFMVSPADLGPVTAVISDAALQNARAMMADPDAVPPGIDLFPLIRKPGDPRVAFRALEAETVRYFSAGESFKRRLSQLRPDLIWPDFAPSATGEAGHRAETALALACPGEIAHAEAAAGEDDGRQAWANHIEMKGGRIERISILEVGNLERAGQDAGISFTGRIEIPPGRTSHLIACMSDRDGRLQSDEDQVWAPEISFFFVFFPVSDEFIRLHLAVVTEEA